MLSKGDIKELHCCHLVALKLTGCSSLSTDADENKIKLKKTETEIDPLWDTSPLQGTMHTHLRTNPYLRAIRHVKKQEKIRKIKSVPVEAFIYVLDHYICSILLVCLKS